MNRVLPVLIKDMTSDEITMVVEGGTEGRRIVLTEKINPRIEATVYNNATFKLMSSVITSVNINLSDIFAQLREITAIPRNRF